VKRKLWFTALIPLLLAGLLLMGCPTAKTGTSSTTTDQLQAQITAQGQILAALQGDMADVKDELDETSGVTQSDIDALQSDIDALQASINELTGTLNTATADIVILKDVAALKGSGTTPPVTGQVTVQLVDNSLCVQNGQLRVYSGPAPGMQYTFTVDIVNGTSQYQYVSFGLILNCINPANATVEAPTALTVFGGYGVTYTKILIPATNTTQVLFTPSTKVSIAANGTLQMQLMLVMQTSASAQWEGSVTGVVVTSTW